MIISHFFPRDSTAPPAGQEVRVLGSSTREVLGGQGLSSMPRPSSYAAFLGAGWVGGWAGPRLQAPPPLRRSSPWCHCPSGRSPAGTHPEPRRQTAWLGSPPSGGPRHSGPWQSLQTPGGGRKGRGRVSI